MNDFDHNLVTALSIIFKFGITVPKTYSKPSQTSKLELFAKIISSRQQKLNHIEAATRGVL